jgi:colicin V production protein
VAALPFNLFDCLLGVVLVAGLVRGRKHGFSEEVFRVIKWLVVVFGCAVAYRPLGALAVGAGAFRPLSAYLTMYLGTALLVLLLFSVLERRLGPKLAGTDAFGRGEYYLSMGSAIIRYGCVLMMSLALLNAREFTPAELTENQQYQEQAYGSTVFPGLHNLQMAVFEHSFIGARIKQNLSFLLIQPTTAGQASPLPTSATLSKAR